MTLLAIVVAAAASLLLMPAAIFFVECVASLFLRAGTGVTRPEGVSVGALIPAHDEKDGIGPTVVGLRAQLTPADRVIVVADNCTDGTADRAREAGAEVIERLDPQRRGKGYALAFGIDHLESNPPDCVVLMGAAIGDRILDAFSRATRIGRKMSVASPICVGRPIAILPRWANLSSGANSARRCPWKGS